MNSTVKSLLGCGVFVASLGLSSLAHAKPPSSSTDSSSGGAWPQELPYEEGQRIPSGYKIDERVRLGLVIPGPILLGVCWSATAFYGLIGSALGASYKPYGALFAPVAGPFIFAGADAVTGSETFLYVVDGVLQTAGLAMIIGGIVAKEKVLVRKGTATISRPEILVGPGSIGMKFNF